MSRICTLKHDDLQVELECDNCFERAGTKHASTEEAYEAGRLLGWLILADGDYCPRCQKYINAAALQL